MSEPRIGQYVWAGCAQGRYVGWGRVIYRFAQGGGRATVSIKRAGVSTCSGVRFWKDATDEEVWRAYRNQGRWA